jgi:hypothetical protein
MSPSRPARRTPLAAFLRWVLAQAARRPKGARARKRRQDVTVFARFPASKRLRAANDPDGR